MTIDRRGSLRLWSAETGIFLVIWLVLLAAGRTRMIRDPGTLWHPVVGRLIIHSRDVIRRDPFSFRHEGNPWLSHQWIGEVVMALIDRAAGLDGLLLATVTLLAATYAWAARRMIARGVSWPIAAIMVTLAIAASSYHFHPRPHVIGIPLMGLLLAVLAAYEAGRCGWRRLLWLVPMFVVWVNTHGTALGGMASLWLVVLGWIALRTPLGRLLPIRSPPPIMPAVGAALAVALTCLVNPFGTDMPRVWVALLSSPSLPKLIVEHRPLSLGSLDGWTVLAFGLVYLVLLWRNRRSIPGVTSLLPLVWLVLSIQRIRHGPLFSITALIAMADLLPALRRVPTSEPTPARPPWYAAACLPALVVTIAAACQIGGLRAPVIGAGWVQLDPSYWPVGALPALRARMADGPAARRVLNEMTFGGFLIYHVPEARVFIDDRCELYGEDELWEAVNARAERPAEIDRWSQRHDARTALVAAGSTFDEYLRTSTDWTCAFRDACCALYFR